MLGPLPRMLVAESDAQEVSGCLSSPVHHLCPPESCPRTLHSDDSRGRFVLGALFFYLRAGCVGPAHPPPGVKEQECPVPLQGCRVSQAEVCFTH